MKEYEYYVVSKYGPTYKFSDINYFLEFVRTKSFGQFGNHLTEKRWRYIAEIDRNRFCCSSFAYRESLSRETELVNVDYVAYRSNDEVVPVRSIEYNIYQISWKHPNPNRGRRHCCWKTHDPNYPGFRNGPVPHTGGGKWYHNYNKRMRTTQERRMNCAHTEYTRGKRRNLSSSWDDIGRSDMIIKQSWKKQKKRKQWM